MAVVGELTLYVVEKITQRRQVFGGFDPFIATELTFWAGGKKVFIVRGYTEGDTPPVIEMVPNDPEA